MEGRGLGTTAVLYYGGNRPTLEVTNIMSNPHFRIFVSSSPTATGQAPCLIPSLMRLMRLMRWLGYSNNPAAIHPQTDSGVSRSRKP